MTTRQRETGAGSRNKKGIKKTKKRENLIFPAANIRGKEEKSKIKLSEGPDWEDQTRMEVEDEA